MIIHPTKDCLFLVYSNIEAHNTANEENMSDNDSDETCINHAVFTFNLKYDERMENPNMDFSQIYFIMELYTELLVHKNS